MLILYSKNRHFLTLSLASSKVSKVERQTIPHLNALVGGFKMLEEQIRSSFRGCRATSSLKSMFFLLERLRDSS